MLVGAFPSQDVGGYAVEEPTVVGDNYGATGECQQSIFQAGEGFHVQVVGGLVQQQQVTALLEGKGQVQAVTLTTGEHTGGLLLVCSLETESGHVGA